MLKVLFGVMLAVVGFFAATHPQAFGTGDIETLGLSLVAAGFLTGAAALLDRASRLTWVLGFTAVMELSAGILSIAGGYTDALGNTSLPTGISALLGTALLPIGLIWLLTAIPTGSPLVGAVGLLAAILAIAALIQWPLRGPGYIGVYVGIAIMCSGLVLAATSGVPDLARSFFTRRRERRSGVRAGELGDQRS